MGAVKHMGTPFGQASIVGRCIFSEYLNETKTLLTRLVKNDFWQQLRNDFKSLPFACFRCGHNFTSGTTELGRTFCLGAELNLRRN
jgi:hypothetical protein